MARRLHIFLHSALAGHLDQDDSGNLTFRYTPEWLAATEAVPLSAALPLRPAVFSRRECRPFFAGLLPEESQRSLIAGQFGISERNDFALLERIGGECAGAVSLMPPGEQPSAGPWSSEPLTDEALAAKLAELPKKPLLAGEAGLRLSLAGAQSKMAVIVEDGTFRLPLHGAPSTHILKPQSARFDHLVENEALCMTLAAAAGLETARVEIREAAGVRFLQIERYDRRRTAHGKLERVHQEDFCQALGLAPELKYQQEGGPGLRQCFALVRAVSSAPAVDVLRLFDAVVFNFLSGNGDAHGKNFSFLYDGSQARLAPLYDLVCTVAWPELDAHMAMNIGRQRDPAKLRREDWEEFFTSAGLGTAPAWRRVREVCDRVRQAVAKPAKPLPGQQAMLDCIATRLVSLPGR